MVLIAAGGSGGHIYPALAIARALKSQRPQLQIEFVGSAAGLENKLIPREGFLLHHLPVGRLNRNARSGERIKTLFVLPFGLLKAALLVLKIRPVFVLGVGGFVTGPVVLVAALFGKKAFLWEPNAHPGMANRWLAPFVTRCFVVFDEAAKRLRSRKIVKVGMPVREEIETLNTTPDPNSESVLNVLIFGGSQGARGINQTVSTAISRGGDWLKGIRFVHQTGGVDFENVKTLYGEGKAEVEVKEYLHDMARRYEWADLVVARAGTGTVSELAACGKAAILVPLPTAADNHQQRNAEALVQKNAAVMVLQSDFTPEHFVRLITDFKSNRQRIDLLSKNIRQFHRPRADQEIARLLLEIAQA